MSSDSDKLHEIVTNLHSEMEQLDASDPEVRDELRGALGEIQQALAEGKSSPAEKADDEKSLIEQLTSAAQHYEDTHPHLSRMIGSVIDTLARMGI